MALNLKLNEPIVVELAERIRADLPAIIAEINAEVTDGAELELIPDDRVLEYVPDAGSMQAGIPVIGIGDGPQSFEDDIGSSATGVYEQLIVVFVQDADQERLARLLRRYVRALAIVVLKNRRLDSAWGIGLRRIIPGPTLADNATSPQTWLSWTGVQIWCKTDED